MRVRGGCGPPPLSILDKSRVSITPVNKQNQKPNSGTISLKLKIMKKMKKRGKFNMLLVPEKSLLHIPCLMF